jgi:hypothetical protein
LSGLLFSCEDDFLERSPLTSINDGNFWETPNDLKSYVNNFYNSMLASWNTWNAGPWRADAANGADNDITISYNKRMNGENTLPTSGGGWSASDWAALRNINYFFDHYKTAVGDATAINQYVGEALFFRALFYFDKLRTFGDVPWLPATVNIGSDLLYASRTPRNEVAAHIMDDLDLAVSYLPARANGAWTGRVTKEAALALQARIALYEGTWERHHARKNTAFKVDGADGTALLQKAADAAGSLIALADANGYPALDNTGVEDGYWLLFNRKDYSASKEVLLWRKYSFDDGLLHHWISTTGTGDGCGISKSMIDSYLCMDGQPIALSPLYLGDDSVTHVVANRDPRLNQTIQVPDSKHYIWIPDEMFSRPSIGASSSTANVTGYQRYKGHSADNAEYANGQQSTTGCIYFRYAETLLIYAEAKAELGTLTQADADKTVNALRTRVGMTGLLDVNNIATDPNWEFTGISPLLQEIRRERKVELCCEGFRVDDIFRWAAADELLVGKRPLGAKRLQFENIPDAPATFTAGVRRLTIDARGYIDPYQGFRQMANGYQFNLDRDYLSPLPTNELVLNRNLTQNPGWETGE